MSLKNILKVLQTMLNYTNVVEKIKTEALWNELIYAKYSSKIKINQEEIKKKLINTKKNFSKSYLII